MRCDHAARPGARKPSDDLLPLIEAGYDLIPLTWPLLTPPGGAGWRTVDHGGFDAVAHMDADRAVGIRLRDEDQVIDADPLRPAELERLEADVGVRLRAAPCAVMPGRSLRIFLKKPADWPTVSELHDYTGVSFWTGDYVVAPGTLHPSGRRYEWGFGPPVKDAPRVRLQPRPTIRVAPGELHRVLDEAEQALVVAAGRDILTRGSKVVRRGEGGALVPVTATWLRERLSRAAVWLGPTGRRIDPPRYVASGLLARDGWLWKFEPAPTGRAPS